MAVNETIQITQKLTFEQITAVTNTTPMILGGVAVLFILLLVYVLIALNRHPRSGSRVYEGNMLSNFNGWIPIFLIVFLGGALMFFMFYYPIWTKLL